MECRPDCDDIQNSSSAVGGVKLPYFHRSQSQQDKDLIGDITPKVINLLSDPSTGCKSILSSASWNTADTWEERDCSERSSENMRNIFSSDFEISCDGYCLKLGTIGIIELLCSMPSLFSILFLHYLFVTALLVTRRRPCRPLFDSPKLLSKFFADIL